MTNKPHRINPLDARRRYTDFPQTSQRRQTAVYRPNGFLPRTPADGIPSIRFLGHSRRRTVYNLCFLMHTGPAFRSHRDTDNTAAEK